LLGSLRPKVRASHAQAQEATPRLLNEEDALSPDLVQQYDLKDKPVSALPETPRGMMPIEGLALVELDELPAGHEALALAQLAQPWSPRSRWSGSSVLRKVPRARITRRRSS
jgi:hypothetical protein